MISNGSEVWQPLLHPRGTFRVLYYWTSIQPRGCSLVWLVLGKRIYICRTWSPTLLCDATCCKYPFYSVEGRRKKTFMLKQTLIYDKIESKNGSRFKYITLNFNNKWIWDAWISGFNSLCSLTSNRDHFLRPSLNQTSMVWTLVTILIVGPWTNYLTSLGLSVLFSKMEIILVPASWAYN